MSPELLVILQYVAAALGGYAVKHIGLKLPIIHQLLVALFGDPTSPPPTPASPGNSGSSPAGPAPASPHPVLDSLQAFIKQILAHPTATPQEKATAINAAMAAATPLATKPAT